MSSHSRHRVLTFVPVVVLVALMQAGCSMLPWNQPPQVRGGPPGARYAAPRPQVASQPQQQSQVAARPEEPAPMPVAMATAQRVEPAAADRQHEVDDLVAEALTAPRMDQRTIAALRASDRAVAGLADTITAIEEAEKIVVDNLRNLDSTGFKSSRAVAGDKGIASIQLNMEQGALENTGRVLDVGIQGEGFFAVKTLGSAGGGVGYTRNGNFFVNNKGELVLGVSDTYKLIPPINVPAGVTNITIGQEGAVQGTKTGSSAKVQLGQVILCQFTNASGLQRLGGGIFSQSETSGPALEYKPGEGGAGQIIQGFLETSNVDMNRERMRLRFLQNWRDTLVRAIEGDPAPRARPASSSEGPR